MKNLPCGNQSDAFLSVSLQMAGGSRVYSFSDSSWHFEKNKIGRLKRVGKWKKNFVLSLSDYYPRGVSVSRLLVYSISKAVKAVCKKSLLSTDVI